MITILPQTTKTRYVAFAATLAIASLMVAGCGHHQKNASIPSRKTAPSSYPPPSTKQRTASIPVTPAPPGGVNDDDLNFIRSHRPIQTQEGLATWYTAPYKGRKSANGQVFDDNAYTAAHRTLPMGSLVLVTNLKTNQSTAMRITDRGPFVNGRVIDLSTASAKAVGVYRAGVAQVRIDVYQTPKPIEIGGRWCVQIGAFSSEDSAVKLKEQLIRKYPDAKVIEFPGDKSFWVRIRPHADNREQAEYIAKHLKSSEAEAFLTRLD